MTTSKSTNTARTIQYSRHGKAARLAFIGGGGVLTYSLICLAIDSGSLWQYATILVVVMSILRTIFLLVRDWIAASHANRYNKGAEA